MPTSTAPESASVIPFPAPPAWMGLLANLFVLAALAVLVVVPLLVNQRVDAVRARVENQADPARTLVGRLQFNLAREAGMLVLASLTERRTPMAPVVARPLQP